jgi:HSP20 family protein
MLQVTRNQPVLAPVREMFNTLADGLAGTAMPGTLPVDIFEHADHYEIRASVPGFTRDQITIEIENGVLDMSAIRTDPELTDADGETCGSDCCMLRRERYNGSLGRQIRLPSDVDDNTVVAKLDNGVLTITVARPAENAPRRITIA